MALRHGHSRSGRNGSATPTYQAWQSMLARCFNPAKAQYADYGGRGITVAKRWLLFENFLKDMGERPANRSLDRIDNDGNYEPSNCRWATRLEQNRNTRKTRATRCKHGHPFTPENTYITANGRRRCRACWREAAAKYRAGKKIER